MPGYALDDETTIQVVDDAVAVVSEGHRKHFDRRWPGRRATFLRMPLDRRTSNRSGSLCSLAIGSSLNRSIVEPPGRAAISAIWPAYSRF